MALALEANVSVGLGEQRVVHAETDIDPRPEAGPALPHEDASGGHELAAEPLDPEHLRIGIAAVSRAPDTLFVCHTLRLDPGDTHGRHRLAMTAMTPIVLPALELDDQHLGALPLGDHLASDPGTRQGRRLDGHLAFIVEEQDLVELD